MWEVPEEFLVAIHGFVAIPMRGAGCPRVTLSRSPLYTHPKVLLIVRLVCGTPPAFILSQDRTLH